MKKNRFEGAAEVRFYTPTLPLDWLRAATTSEQYLSILLGDFMMPDSVETALQRYLSQSASPAFIEMISDLAETAASDDYDCEDFLRPTEYSINTLWQLLVEASRRSEMPIPLGTIVAYGDGGLRIEWIRSNREVRLVIASTRKGKSYIYFESGDMYAAEYNPTAQKLADRLDWLVAND